MINVYLLLDCQYLYFETASCHAFFFGVAANVPRQ